MTWRKRDSICNPSQRGQHSQSTMLSGLSRCVECKSLNHSKDNLRVLDTEFAFACRLQYTMVPGKLRPLLKPAFSTSASLIKPMVWTKLMRLPLMQQFWCCANMCLFDQDWVGRQRRHSNSYRKMRGVGERNIEPSWDGDRPWSSKNAWSQDDWHYTIKRAYCLLIPHERFLRHLSTSSSLTSEL